MAIKGSDAIGEINSLYQDGSNAIWKAAQKLAAVNSAISKAWPHIGEVDIDSSITLSSTTVEYTPTATAELERGFSVAHVDPITSNNPKVLLRRVTQRLDGSVWKIVLPKDIVQTYDTKTLYLQYVKRLSRLTTESDTVELPIEYVVDAALLELLGAKVILGASDDVKPFAEMIPEIRQRVESFLLRNKRGRIPNLIPVVSDVGLMTTVDPNQGYYNA